MAIFNQPIPSSGYNAIRTMLNPNDPDYLKKMGTASALEGHHELEQEKQQPDTMGGAPAIGNAGPPSASIGTPGTLSMGGQPSAPPPPEANEGVLGKIGHGFAHAGNVIGSALFPTIAQNVPGSIVYNRDTAIRHQQQANVEAERGLKEKALENEAANRQATLGTKSRAEDEIERRDKEHEAETLAKQKASDEFKHAQLDFQHDKLDTDSAFKQKNYELGSKKLEGQLSYWDAMEKRAARDSNDKDAQLEVERGKLQVMQYDSALKKAAQDLKGTKEGADAQLASDKIEQNGTFKRWFGDTSGEAAQATAATTATRAGAPTPELPANFAGAPAPAKGGAKAAPYKVGQTVHLKGGKTGTIKAVHSDGSFDLN